jgi:hypothetical protein
MSKFTFICEQYDYDEYTGEQKEVVSKTTKEFYGHTLEGILDEMTTFLRGTGYHFEGHLDVVSYEDLIDKIDEQVDEFENDEQSHKVMQHIVQDLLKNPIASKSTDDIFINSDNMNSSFVIGSNDWNNGAAMPTLAIDDRLDLSGITISSLNTDPIFSEQYTFDFSEYVGNCEVCNLPKSVMSVHKCYDDNCPLYAPKN